jgi:hypothetical protein
MYRIVLDELVLEKDLKRIDPRDQERIALVGFRRNEEAYDKMMRRVKPLSFIRRRRSSRRP